MPDLFSGLTGALTAARTGQLQGQNQGALTSFALQMQLAELARQQRAQDIADRAEQAREGYYEGENANRQIQQRRADALAGIRKATPVDPQMRGAAAGLGITLPDNLQESGVTTGTPVTGPDADQGVVPLTQLGQGEVYDPTQNLNNQMNQDRLDAAMERARLAQEGANSRNNLRLTEGPNGVRTSDAQRFGRIVTQQIGIYSKPHPGAVAGINEPALSPQQATLQATIDAATIYPEEAMRRYPNNTVIVAAAQRALRNKAAVRAAPVQAQGPAQPFGSVAVPGLPTGGAGGGPSAAAGGVRKPTGDEVALATGDPKYKAFLAKTGVDVSGIP